MEPTEIVIKQIGDNLRMFQMEHDHNHRRAVQALVQQLADEEWVVSMSTACHPENVFLFVTTAVFAS